MIIAVNSNSQGTLVEYININRDLIPVEDACTMVFRILWGKRENSKLAHKDTPYLKFITLFECQIGLVLYKSLSVILKGGTNEVT